MFHSWTQISLFLVLVIFPVLASAKMDAKIHFCFKFRVHVINGFGNNNQPLLIHCQSNDDDLGNQTLWMNQDFNFHFGVSLFKKTHFTCDMKWGAHHKFLDVFTGNVEEKVCCDTGACFWRAREDGIYFSVDNANWEKKYDWE